MSDVHNSPFYGPEAKEDSENIEMRPMAMITTTSDNATPDETAKDPPSYKEEPIVTPTLPVAHSTQILGLADHHGLVKQHETEHQPAFAPVAAQEVSGDEHIARRTTATSDTRVDDDMKWTIRWVLGVIIGLVVITLIVAARTEASLPVCADDANNEATPWYRREGGLSKQANRIGAGIALLVLGSFLIAGIVLSYGKG